VKQQFNKSGQVPPAVVKSMVGFAFDLYGGTLDHVDEEPVGEYDELPKLQLMPQRVTQKRASAGSLPDPQLYAVGGGGSPVALTIVDFRTVCVSVRCVSCSSVDTAVVGLTLAQTNMLGIDVIVNADRPSYSIAAISECRNGCLCTSTTGKKPSNSPLKFRHDSKGVLSQLKPGDRLLYSVDPPNARGKYRLSRNAVSLVNDVALSSDSGAATLLASLSVCAAERRSHAHLSYISALRSFAELSESIVGDEKWDSLLASGEDLALLYPQRDALLRIKGQHSSLKYDDSPNTAGTLPLDPDTVQRMLEFDRESRLSFRRREVQRIKVGENDVLSMDGCVPIGTKLQAGDGKGGRGKEAVIVVAKQQIVAATITDSKLASEVTPMLSAGYNAGWRPHLMVVDDMSDGSTGPSWHSQGAAFERVLSVQKVLQDLMHQEARIRQTQQIFHDKRPEGTRRLKRCYTQMPMGEYNRMKLMASTPAGSAGGFKPGGSLRVALLTDKTKKFKEGDSMTHHEFDSLYLGVDSVPNALFEIAFKGQAVPESHPTASIQIGLADYYRWSAGSVVGHCGNCDDCGDLPAGWREARDESGRLYYFEVTSVQWEQPAENDSDWGCMTDKASKRIFFFKVGAVQWGRPEVSESRPPAPATVPPPPPPPGQPTQADLLGACKKPRRAGLLDKRSGRCLNSASTEAAVELAIANAGSCEWPGSVPRMIWKKTSTGAPCCNSLGLAGFVSQQGTTFVENVNGRIETALSAAPGYRRCRANLIAHEATSKINTLSRRTVFGEEDVGHDELYLLDLINTEYVALGWDPYYSWRSEPPPDDGRRFWDDERIKRHVPATQAPSSRGAIPWGLEPAGSSTNSSSAASSSYPPITRVFRPRLASQPLVLGAQDSAATHSVISSSSSSMDSSLRCVDEDAPQDYEEEAVQSPMSLLHPTAGCSISNSSSNSSSSSISRSNMNSSFHSFDNSGSEDDEDEAIQSVTCVPLMGNDVASKGAGGSASASSSGSTPARYYRKDPRGEYFPMPPETEMLMRNLERSPYPCKCTKIWAPKRNIWMKPRTHDSDCLHGVAVKLQQGSGGKVRKRTRVGK